jgi:hypothetical protein
VPPSPLEAVRVDSRPAPAERLEAAPILPRQAPEREASVRRQERPAAVEVLAHPSRGRGRPQVTLVALVRPSSGREPRRAAPVAQAHPSLARARRAVAVGIPTSGPHRIRWGQELLAHPRWGPAAPPEHRSGLPTKAMLPEERPQAVAAEPAA